MLGGETLVKIHKTFEMIFLPIISTKKEFLESTKNYVYYWVVYTWLTFKPTAKSQGNTSGIIIKTSSKLQQAGFLLYIK